MTPVMPGALLFNMSLHVTLLFTYYSRMFTCEGQKVIFQTVHSLFIGAISFSEDAADKSLVTHFEPIG